MWLGKVEAPHTLTWVQPLFTDPWSKSEQCWVDAGASTRPGWWKGARGRGAEIQLLNTLHLGLANSLAWQK